MLNAGDVLCDRYEIIRVIGKGGMSTVYHAQDLKTKKELAIKDIRRSGTEKDQVVEQSLMAEGRMLKQLSHPRLPRIYDIIETEATIMLVMDFIHGESLDKVLTREGPKSVKQTLEWGMQICEVFHYLHTQHTPIIYRDMKPANVMLQPNGQLMLIDFGTARTQKIGVEMQADTRCIGTEGFAAPEQYGGIGQSTARTDIFCLGATLYNIVTGHNPSMPPMGIMPLGEWNPALTNSPVAEIITKCTRNDPDERYQTAMDLYDDLKQASIGAYEPPAKRGKTISFSGNIRKVGFQRQEHGGNGMITSGLSDLLHLGASQRQPEMSTVVPNSKASADGWQYTHQYQPQINHNDIHIEQDKDFLQKIVMIGLALSVAFLLVAVILATIKSYTAAIAVMILALSLSVITLFCLILSMKK